MPISLLDRYRNDVAKGRLEPDPAQAAAVGKLDLLRTQLNAYRPARKSGALGWLFGPKSNGAKLNGTKSNGAFLRGLYIWGSVGRGKTMLMDMFYEEVEIPRKRRVHFHAFMADIHARIYAWRQELKRGAVKGDDPIAPVAEAVANEAWLLCFDEFTVIDIADAMILGRLFKALFARGVVIVATSNVDPADLYKDGLNRALFLPFIDLIAERMEVMRLDARTDFRLEKLQDQPVYYVPPNAKSQAALTHAFKTLTGVEHGAPATLEVLGRKLRVPEAMAHVARFSYADLCEAPLGAADFLAIAEAFHTLILDCVPVIEEGRRNEAKRFITLIDALYDQHVKLIVSAKAEPKDLYLGTSGREAFEFERTASRLIEMRSSAYLSLPHGSVASIGSGDSTGLVET
ncbi:MAG TPA: cell division protein ZapE [Beijerinckia sp.]|nr:cell division protein ZapE [Beijerinckia sp.]